MVIVANLQAINKAGFAKKSWKHNTDFRFAASDAVCLLGAAEVPSAMMAMPLAFVATGGGYSIAAIQGLEHGANYFVNAEGKWIGSYIPAAYRARPFALANYQLEEEKPILCIDTDSGLLIDDDTEEAFYDEELEPMPFLNEIGSFLVTMLTSREASIRMGKVLSTLGLLIPWEVEFKQGDRTKRIDGLFRVDEIALNELPGDAYAELREAGSIAMIYGHLLSMQRISGLRVLAEKTSDLGMPRQSNELDFGGVNVDGNISFDNL